MNSPPRGNVPPFAEFVTLMAMMMSLVALSIDTMLPALPAIGRDLGAAHGNDAQLVVGLLFLGLASGQLIYGPLSDSSGRKPAVVLGFALFFIGALMSLLATSMPVMLSGRYLQGLGLAAPRTLSLAIIRDQYSGRAMARVMSFIMTVFILVPMAAPALGQGILLLAGWRSIFGTIFAIALLTVLWFAVRLPETLRPEARVSFSARRIGRAMAEVCRHRASLGYTLAFGFIFSPFLGYLSSAQQILQIQYGLGVWFPMFFAILALAIGAAVFINGHLVMRAGMRRLCKLSLIIIIVIALLALIFAYTSGGHPSLGWLMAYLALTLFCVGILFGNLNALAMEPLGHIAGVGAAVVGAISTFISVPFGILIGRGYDGTVLPLISGFALFGVLTLGAVLWADRGG